MGESNVEVWRCHDGIGGAEGNEGVSLEEDVFYPKECKSVVQDGWRVGGMDAADGMVKGKGNEADVWAVPNHGRGEGVWWVGSWYCEREQGGFGEWDSKVLSADAAVGCEPFCER